MRALLYALIVAGAVVIQVTILDGLPFPGGAAPDLVLLAVVALALNGGPVPGMATGFAAGLVFDLAPPQTHAIGQSALVLCLLGYLCGLISHELERSIFLPLAAMAIGAAVGAVLFVAVGKIFGDPRYSWAAVAHVLPATVAYDVLASPFVLYIVARLVQLAGVAPVTGGALAPSLAGRPSAGRAGIPGEPRLRVGSGRSSDGWIGVGRPTAGVAGAGSALSQFSGGSSVKTGGTALPGSPARLRLRPSKTARPQAAVATGRRDNRLRLGASTQTRPKNRNKPAAQPRFRSGVGGSALDSDRRLGRGRPRAEPKFRSGGLLGRNGFGGSIGSGLSGGLSSLSGSLGSGRPGIAGGRGRTAAQPKFRSGRLGGGLRIGGARIGAGGLGGRAGASASRVKFGRKGADGGPLARIARFAGAKIGRRPEPARSRTGRSSVYRIGSRETGGTE
jgi:rod shape-determining protein MreD